MLAILLGCHIVVSIGLITVVLLQRSEGGALGGMGGGPSGFMTARGAGDLLTRITWILATLFFVLSLAMTILAGRERGASSVVDRVKMNALAPALAPKTPAAPAGQSTSPAAAPAPLSAPTPAVRNPFTGQTDPAPAQAPKP